MHHLPLQIAVTGLCVSPSPTLMETLGVGEVVGTLAPPVEVGTSGVWSEWPIPAVYTAL